MGGNYGQADDMTHRLFPIFLAAFLTASSVAVSQNEEPQVAMPFMESGLFTGGIEGPACDREGNLYAVSFEEKGNIGIVTPEGKASLFVTLPEGSTGNGIRFDREGIMYVADYTGHNILRIDPDTKAITVLAHEPKMNQPNDIAIGPDGTLYASDPNWKENTGQIWRIDHDGTVTLLAANMGTTNGIEVSPDGSTLYVNESKQRRIWAFTLTDEKTITDKWLVKEFPDHGFDGMRCDIDGNLYVTRHGAGKVIKMTPKGKILREIDVLGAMPSNLCFGGPDGKTVYVTEVEHTRVVTFRADRPGLSWQRWQGAGSNAETETVDLFIVAGQSNAVGFDANPAELPADPNDAKVRFWYRVGDPPPDKHDTTSGGIWTTLGSMSRGDPMPKDKGVLRQYGNFRHPEGGFGPEIGFARTLLSKNPDRRFAIVKAAFSGTGLGRDWDPDDPGESGSCYRALIEEMKLASTAAEEEGITFRIKALLWVQGESDAKPKEVGLYAERMGELVTSLREDLKTPDLAALIAVNTQFGLGKNPQMPGIVNSEVLDGVQARHGTQNKRVMIKAESRAGRASILLSNSQSRVDTVVNHFDPTGRETLSDHVVPKLGGNRDRIAWDPGKKEICESPLSGRRRIGLATVLGVDEAGPGK